LIDSGGIQLTKVALYARVSTSEREDLQDPETQLVVLRDYCRMRQWKIVREFKEHASGMDDNRPVLRELLDGARKGRYDYIVVFRIDRLTRSPLNLLLILEELQDPKTKAYKVNLVSATEGVDTSSRLSEGMLLMLGIFAKMERDGIAERVRAGMERAKVQGTRSGRPVGRPVVQLDITQAIGLLEQGLSKSQVCKLLSCSQGTLNNRLRSSGRGDLVGKPTKGAAKREVPSGAAEHIRKSASRGVSNKEVFVAD